jgi:hypothetical protein
MTLVMRVLSSETLVFQTYCGYWGRVGVGNHDCRSVGNLMKVPHFSQNAVA